MSRLSDSKFIASVSLSVGLLLGLMSDIALHSAWAGTSQAPDPSCELLFLSPTEFTKLGLELERTNLAHVQKAWPDFEISEGWISAGIYQVRRTSEQPQGRSLWEDLGFVADAPQPVDGWIPRHQMQKDLLKGCLKFQAVFMAGIVYESFLAMCLAPIVALPDLRAYLKSRKTLQDIAEREANPSQAGQIARGFEFVIRTSPLLDEGPWNPLDFAFHKPWEELQRRFRSQEEPDLRVTVIVPPGSGQQELLIVFEVEDTEDFRPPRGHRVPKRDLIPQTVQ